jgi:2-hydroxychromene-2-carboxylate isomerase
MQRKMRLRAQAGNRDSAEILMSRMINFYFDFISPFSYLAHQRLPDLAARFGYSLDYRVADLAELKRLAGNTAPRVTTMPLKLRYSRIDQQRWAERYGVPIKPPPASHDSSWLNRGTFYAADRGRIPDYVITAWTKLRHDGRDMGDENVWREIASDLGFSPDEFVAFVRSDDSKNRYQASTREAHERGAFGVPTMIIGEDMWWGNDRLDFLEEFLTAKEGRRAAS